MAIYVFPTPTFSCSDYRCLHSGHPESSHCSSAPPNPLRPRISSTPLDRQWNHSNEYSPGGPLIHVRHPNSLTSIPLAVEVLTQFDSSPYYATMVIHVYHHLVQYKSSEPNYLRGRSSIITPCTGSIADAVSDTKSDSALRTSIRPQ